jgi:Ca2+-transporting ATPase
MPGEIELKKDITEPLIDNNASGFKVKPDAMAKICHTDASHKISKHEKTGAIPSGCTEADLVKTLSSKLLLQDFGGYDNIARLLDTNLTTGIDKNSIKDRHAHFGKNKFPPPKIKTIYMLIMENFDDPINCILLGAAIVSIIIGLIKNGFPKGLVDGVSIIIALMIIIIVNSVNNWISEQKLAALLNSSKVQKVAVHRGSSEETITIDGTLLVVGDLISFASGERVPADCIMISG